MMTKKIYIAPEDIILIAEAADLLAEAKVKAARHKAMVDIGIEVSKVDAETLARGKERAAKNIKQLKLNKQYLAVSNKRVVKATAHLSAVKLDIRLRDGR